MSSITTSSGVTFGTGDRIRATAQSHFIPKDIGTYSLAGMQPKMAGEYRSALDVVGTVIHVKGDSLENPTRCWVYLDVELSKHVLAVEECGTKHPGVKESFFELTNFVKVELLPRERP